MQKNTIYYIKLTGESQINLFTDELSHVLTVGM